MNARQSLWPRRAAHWLTMWILGMVFLAFPRAAWAQAQPAAQGHSDVMAYMLLVFCIALGMIMVCRSAGRTSEVRLEELDEE